MRDLTLLTATRTRRLPFGRSLPFSRSLAAAAALALVAIVLTGIVLGRIGSYQDTRELVLHKNYLITYRVRADEVQFLQIWHAAQRR